MWYIACGIVYVHGFFERLLNYHAHAEGHTHGWEALTLKSLATPLDNDKGIENEKHNIVTLNAQRCNESNILPLSFNCPAQGY